MGSTIKGGTADVPKRFKNKPMKTNGLVKATEAAMDEKKGKTTVSSLAPEFDIKRVMMTWAL